MARLDQLLKSYRRHISVPWDRDAAPMQRVIFCVYEPEDELRFRARVDEFELATIESGYEWVSFDLTDTFARWLAGLRYAESYFRNTGPLSLSGYLSDLTAKITSFVKESDAEAQHMVAVHGVGTLFGLLKVKEVVDQVAPLVQGRLLVFFPGSFEDNNYRLLDGYDGWNYLAVPITVDLDH